MPSTQVSNKRAAKYRVGKQALPYLYMAPTVVFLLVFLISPLITGILLSLQTTQLDGTVVWSGLDNFRNFFMQARSRTNIWKSVLYVVGNVLLTTPLAYGGALLMTAKVPQARFFRGLYLLPWIIPPVVSTLLFRSLIDAQIGPIPHLIEWLTGTRPVILANVNWSMFFIILHSVWRSFPFVMLFLTAGMATIPDSIYEAAVVDGANAWQKFFRITLPITSSHLAIGLITITMWTLHDAETIYAFTEGGPGYATETLAVRLFKASFINFQLNTGATIGVLLILISAAFMLVYMRLMKSGGEV